MNPALAWLWIGGVFGVLFVVGTFVNPYMAIFFFALTLVSCGLSIFYSNTGRGRKR